MSSAICQNFVQNAWKKELCSNCFKSKDEHAERPKPKPVTLISNDKVEGIIRNTNKSKTKRSVCFTKDLSEIIGYGGEDWLSEEEEEEVEENDDDSSEEEFVTESDEENEKELKRITKENTDFNTTNLKEVVIPNKVVPQLQLGRPLVDSSGRKQTLLVSVTPFGEESSHKKPAKNSLSHIPISKNKETVAETKPNVVLTSYTKNEDIGDNKEKTLLEEITETLENSKNPIQIMSRKKIQKEIVLTVPKNDSNKENVSEKKDDQVEHNKPKVSTVDKKVGLSRTPALKRDQEKPVIYQTSTAKIELINAKNTRLNKDNNMNKMKIEPKEQKVDTVDSEPSPAMEAEKVTEKIVEKSAPKDPGLPPAAISKPENPLLPQTREQAGEPDGRADPDTVSDPPALPLTPPPMLEGQTSFLHGTSVYDKPKIPYKPATVLIKKPTVTTHHVEIKNQILTTFSNDPKAIDDSKVKLYKRDSNGSDIALRTFNKKRAPKPPDDVSQVQNTLLPSVQTKRERASSCSPKLQDSVGENPQGFSVMPEAAPRKSLSTSIDNLVSPDDKRKEKSKSRFSLKKFWRMGSNKDLPKVASDTSSEEGRIDNPPLPRPRLVIVHPSELNGAKVEVVAKPNGEPSDYQNVTKHPDHNDYEKVSPKSQKPPPPPRNLDDYRPALSHPPKSTEVLSKQKQYTTKNVTTKQVETVYANIGEVRSSIIPNKPQRTASMREREAQQQKQERKSCNNYELINIGGGGGANGVENVYDYITCGRSSSPESDSSLNKDSPNSKTARLNKRSESSIDVSGDYSKYTNIPRSVSLTYCGSETESEIYSPYSFYGSESEVTEDDHDWIQGARTQKLRSRKGRSIVHKNLEDNYGAVIVANHEALAQVLENIQQCNYIAPALRGLKSLSNHRWSDFSIKPTSQTLVVGSRTFHQALWGSQHVTLVINTGAVASSTLSLGTFSLNPVTEFSDLIPGKYIGKNSENDQHVQANVAVLPWLQVKTLHSYSEFIKSQNSQSHEDNWKDTGFVMLQLVNALKVLQAQGIEELSLSLDSFILCKETDKDIHQRLCVLQGIGEETHLKNNSEKYGTLCMCASKALSLLQPTAKITSLLQSLLNNERAVTLTQVKSILEFCLWGPSDVALGSTIRERELALQRWLDLQRATVLHGLVCTRIQLTVYEECHLFFLVRSNARMMCDASLLLESSNMKHVQMNGHK